MSGYRTHFTTAAWCGVAMIVATHYHVPRLGWLSLANGARIITAMLGGLFPDIDIKSKGQQLLFAIVIPLLIAALLAKKVVFSILLSSIGIIPPLLPHRGITHHLWFSFLAPAVGPFLVYMYCPEHLAFAIDLYCFFVVGALSHLVLDYGPKALFLRSINSWRSDKKPRK